MRRLFNLLPWRRRRMENDLARELQYHIDRRADDLVQSGMNPDQARRRATLEIGRVTQTSEDARETWTWSWMEHAVRDVQYAARNLARYPGFTTTVVITIALGVGANGAMFSFLDRVFIRPPDAVVAAAELRRLYVKAHDFRNPGTFMVYPSFRYPQYESIVAANSGTAIVAYDTDAVQIGSGDDRVAGTAAWVSPNYFSTLGVAVIRGRLFGPDEARIETPTPVAILSHNLWIRRFGGDSAIIGRTIDISKRRFTIVGVAAPGFTGVDVNAIDVFAPMNMNPARGEVGQPWYRSFPAAINLFVRIPEGTPHEPILGRTTFAHNHTPKIPGFGFDTTATVLAGPIVLARGPGDPQREVSIGLRVAGVAIILLLITCANVATLLLVRAMRQRREVALRLALGASKARVYVQAVTESTLLALIGGAFAIGVAWWGGAALRKLLLPNIQWSTGVLDMRVVLVTLAITLIVGIVNGIAPVVLARRRSVIDAMKGSAREGVHQRSLFRSGLLVVQTALSVVLIVGSGLFVRSLGNVRAIEIGYDVDSVMFAYLGGDDARRPTAERALAIARLEERIAKEPGVIATSGSAQPPMLSWTGARIALPDRDSIPLLSGDNPYPMLNNVSPSYFTTVGMRVLAGRGFAPGDSGHVLVVNETMAKTFWPGEDPVGKCVLLGSTDCSYVIGVVSNAHRMRMIETASMNYYLPTRSGTTLVLRADPERWGTISARLRQEMKAILPGSEPVVVRRMTESIDRELRPWRLGASLFVAFGLLAVVVAAVGVYSVIAYAVSQRTHEMGVRIALGAQLTDVLRLVVGEGLKVVVIGAVLGVGAALALGKLVRTLLYGVTPWDPGVMGVAAGVLIVVGILAALTPAWRAARVDPVAALRTD